MSVVEVSLRQAQTDTVGCPPEFTCPELGEWIEGRMGGKILKQVQNDFFEKDLCPPVERSDVSGVRGRIRR
ncbi:hypothetical protein [Ekhidna sp.]|jgi:hypothetical protein|uniref:hypothetical protein n=1 Tax=Ekhidna sp. TaxID=2608089 RepID=UPI0032EAA754